MSVEVLAYQTQQPQQLGKTLGSVPEDSSQVVVQFAQDVADDGGDRSSAAAAPPYSNVPTLLYAHEQRMLKAEVRCTANTNRSPHVLLQALPAGRRAHTHQQQQQRPTHRAAHLLLASSMRHSVLQHPKPVMRPPVAIVVRFRGLQGPGWWSPVGPMQSRGQAG